MISLPIPFKPEDFATLVILYERSPIMDLGIHAIPESFFLAL